MRTNDKLLVTVGPTGNNTNIRDQIKLFRKLTKLMFFVEFGLAGRQELRPLHWSVEFRPYGNTLMDIRVALTDFKHPTQLFRKVMSQDHVPIEISFALITLDSNPIPGSDNLRKLASGMVEALMSYEPVHRR